MKRPSEDSSSAESDVEEDIDVGRESVYPGSVRDKHGNFYQKHEGLAFISIIGLFFSKSSQRKSLILFI